MKKLLMITFGVGALSIVPSLSAQPIADSNMRAAITSAVPSGLTLSWSVPDHLLEDAVSSAATEASAAEFRDSNGVNRATIILLRTQCTEQNPVGVYPHDYRRCGSIHVRYVRKIEPKNIHGGWFYELETIKRDSQEYEISFIVQDTALEYLVDSELLSSQYDAKCNGAIYNFQVWSADPETTKTLVASILSFLAGRRTLAYENNSPKNVPTVLINLARFHNGVLEIAATSTRAVSATVTVIAWIAPNPTPVVEVHNINLREGIDTASFPVNLGAILATEFEIQVREGGSFLDGVLVAPNHFGGYSSSWIPFSGGGSTVAVKSVADFPPASYPVGYSLNDSVVELSGSLAVSGFCGMFIDLLPERSDALDLGGFDTLSFQGLRINSNGVAMIDVKIETKSGTQYAQSIILGDTWKRHALLFSDFTPNQNWSQLGKEIKRITIVAVHRSGGVQSVAARFGDFAVHRKPILSLTVLGSGTVTVPAIGMICDNVAWSSVERNRPLKLVASPKAGHRFVGWSGSDDALDGNVSLSEDMTCIATFAPLDPPLKVNLAQRGGDGSFFVFWLGQIGRTYFIEATDTLPQTTWVKVGQIITTTSGDVSFDLPVLGRQQFYRVRSLQDP